MGKTTLTSVGGVIAAIFASLCCIGPVMLAFMGVSSIAAFSALETYRPYLIGFTISLIGIAFFFTYRKREVKCEDGTCKVVRAGLWNKIGVWTATVIAVGALAFPYFGFTASSSSAKLLADSSLSVERDVSFFNVPLVCNAAPLIGCGSRAKFVMLDLMKDSTVNGAWLNRRGTVVAVVWNAGADEASRQAVLKSVFSKHELPIEQVRVPDRNALIEDFKVKSTWYKGSDVDALSVEEAGVIADRILAVVGSHAKFSKYEDSQTFREEVKAIIQNHFLSIKSFDELDATLGLLGPEISAIAEKYLGKGKLPEIQIMRSEYNALRDKDEACCKDSSQGAACCAKSK